METEIKIGDLVKVGDLIVIKSDYYIPSWAGAVGLVISIESNLNEDVITFYARGKTLRIWAGDVEVIRLA